MLAGKSRTPAPELPFTSQLSQLALTSYEFFLPTAADVAEMKKNLTVIIGRILTEYSPTLTSFFRVVPKHILHRYSAQMSMESQKSLR